MVQIRSFWLKYINFEVFFDNCIESLTNFSINDVLKKKNVDLNLIINFLPLNILLKRFQMIIYKHILFLELNLSKSSSI